MNPWLLIVGAWLMDFAAVATALLVAAAAMRVVLRDPASRVLLAWGTWLSLLGSGLLMATPWWPRYEIAQFIERRSQPAVVVVFADTELALPEPVIVMEAVNFTPPPAVAPATPQSSLISHWP